MGILNPWNLQLILEQAQGAGARRRRRGHRVGRGDRDGARLRRRADEHGDRAARRIRCGWRARCGSPSRPDAKRSSPGACRASCTRRARARRRPASSRDALAYRTAVLRAHAARVAALRSRSRRVCCAAPPTPAELAKLCAERRTRRIAGAWSRRASCARLKRFAARDGDELRIDSIPVGIDGVPRRGEHHRCAHVRALGLLERSRDASSCSRPTATAREFWMRAAPRRRRVPSSVRAGARARTAAPRHRRLLRGSAATNEVAVWRDRRRAACARSLRGRRRERGRDASVAWKDAETSRSSTRRPTSDAANARAPARRRDLDARSLTSAVAVDDAGDDPGRHRRRRRADRRSRRVRRASCCARAGCRRRSSALASSCCRATASRASAPLDWSAVFGRRAPVVLEIGFGMGETTAAIAAAQPDVDFLGVEVHRPGVGALLRRLDAADSPNVRVIRARCRRSCRR